MRAQGGRSRSTPGALLRSAGTPLRPTPSMSITSAAVAMSGSVIMFLSCLVRSSTGADQDSIFGFCRVARLCSGARSAPADAAAFCSVVGGGVTGVVLLVLDFVGG